MIQRKQLYFLCAAVVLFLTCFFLVSMRSQAAEKKEEYEFPVSGVAEVLDPSALSNDAPVEEEKELNINQKFENEKARMEKELAMANVQNALNIRAEADEKSEKVGYLYKDCGGTILERKDGWTRIKSGNVIGWAKDEYLLFGEFIDEVNNSWISVDYNDEVGYVNTDFINVKFHIDEGETMEVIKVREQEEAERKRKANRGAVSADADEVRLLGALIYCEAGNQPYEGKLGVGAVVMNRVRSGAYPNTIHAVIYASGQFTPAMTGKVARAYEGNVPESCLQAAQAAINGETTIGDATHFRRAGKREGYVIGDHVFW